MELVIYQGRQYENLINNSYYLNQCKDKRPEKEKLRVL